MKELIQEFIKDNLSAIIAIGFIVALYGYYRVFQSQQREKREKKTGLIHRENIRHWRLNEMSEFVDLTDYSKSGEDYR